MSDVWEDELRSVFDLCDQQNLGYINVNDFMELARLHFSTEGNEEEITNVIDFLDPGSGKIYFPDFCAGVKKILERTQSVGTPPQSPIFKKNPFFRKPSNDANVNNNTINVSNSPGLDISENSYTFNEYDTTTTDDDNHSVSLPKIVIETDSNLNKPEENFEDYGDESELILHSQKPKIRHRRYPGSGDSWPFCRSTPKSERKSISQLHKSETCSPSNSRHSSITDDDFLGNIDGSFLELNGKVKTLESQINQLTEYQEKNDFNQGRIKIENQSLVERIHTLEMELREVEERNEKRVMEEENKYRDLLNRTDREKEREIQLLSASLQHIESEYNQYKTELPKLRLEAEKLERENKSLQAKYQRSDYDLESIINERDQLQTKLRQVTDELYQERNVNTQLIDELSKELEELRNDPNKRQRRPSSPDSINYPPNYRRQLENIVIRLKEDNARLKDQNDDLQAQLLGHTIIEGHTLLSAGVSLADEIDCMPKEELTKALRETQDDNRKLKEYVQNLTSKIIETNPSILEKQ